MKISAVHHFARTTSSTSTRLLFFLVLVLTLFMVLNVSLTGAQEVIPLVPPNDNFANAWVIGFPSDTVTFNIDEATSEVNEPAHACLPGTGYGVWFTFTVGTSGTFSADTTLSNYGSDDTVMSLYTGTFPGLTDIACNDDAGGDTYAVLSNVALTAGTYYLKVSNWIPENPGDEDLTPTDFLRLIANFIPDASATPTITPGGPTLTPSVTPGGPTLTPTDTLVPTDTPTDAPTITPGGPTLTSTPVAPTLVPSSTPTLIVQPGTQLLMNGGMETLPATGKTPANWVLKKGSGDKQKCTTPEKTVAHSDACAFAFKGSATENSKLVQNVVLDDFDLALDDLLTLEAYTRVSSAEAVLKLKFIVIYSDSTPKEKITINAPVGETYIKSTTATLLASDALQKISVQFQNRSKSGKVYVDTVSLLQAP